MIRIILIALFALASVGCQSKEVASDSSFRDSVRNGRVALVQRHLNDGYDIHRLGMGGENALQEGVLHYEVAKLLIDKGIEVNQQHKFDGSTPLIVSCIAANVEVRTVGLLLDSGADPLLKDTRGKSALDYADEYTDEQARESCDYAKKAELLRAAIKKIKVVEKDSTPNH